MRSWIALALLCTSCASFHDARLRIDIAEVHNLNKAGPVGGPHHFRVTVVNASTDAIAIQSIKLDLGTPELKIDDPAMELYSVIEPKTYASFDVYVTVRVTGGSPVGYLDSVDIFMSCEGAEGAFVETGRYPVSHVLNDASH